MDGILSRILNGLTYRRMLKKYSNELVDYPIEKLTKSEKKEIKDVYENLGLGLNFDIRWFGTYKYYKGEVSPYCLPKDIWKYMEYVLNPIKYRFMQHKGMLYRYIDKKYLPTLIVNKMFGVLYDDSYNVISNQEAIEIILKNDEFVFKPTDVTGGGHGVELISLKNKNDNEKNAICKELLNRDNFICQKTIVPNIKISKYNKYPLTVNTIRCITLCLNGRVSVVSSYMRMGGSDVLNDNVGLKEGSNRDPETASAYAGIKEDGTFCGFSLNMIDMSKKRFKSPSGIILKGEKLDYYDKIKSVVLELHAKLPMLGFIAWDVTLDAENNVRVIEINLDSQDIEDHHVFNGPVFKSRINELFEYVKKHPVKLYKM